MPDTKTQPDESTIMQTETHTVLDSALLTALRKTEVVPEDRLHAIEMRSKGEQSVFEKLLVDEGYLIDSQLGRLKAQVHGWNFVNLNEMNVSDEMIALLPATVVRTHKVLPYQYKDDVRIAMGNPDNLRLQRLLKKRFGADVHIAHATESDVSEAFGRHDKEFLRRCEDVLEQYDHASKTGDTDDRSIIELVDALLIHGVRSRASDIHIEPREGESVVRERVDGVLDTTLRFAKPVHELVSTRIKVLANLAIDEHSKPQDGKLSFVTPDGKDVDVRVSISPITKGEKIVLRLLSVRSQALSMEALGMHNDDLAILQKSMSRSWGMVLVTGPTGSGKTTTLYSGVRRINTDDVNIETIEDPVEYDVPGINQIQVNEKANVTFANGLRSIVRQDPNIILVGEIRDGDTAAIAVNAAMTGHLVLSTLHTNDAATALPRLADMGIEPFVISSTVNVIVAQRLVRNICKRCRKGKDVPVSELKESLPKEVLTKLAKKKKTVHLYEGEGCPVCNGNGYMGRTGVFEILEVTPEIQALIMQNADADTIKKAAVKGGMKTMMDDGIEKVLEGVTTLEELLRAIRS